MAKLPSDAVLQELRAFGLTFPGTALKSPWPEHLDLAVKDKTFAYLPLDGQPFHIGVKLPVSNGKALLLPGAAPSGYGLGKAGWVDVPFPTGLPPIDLLREWLEESYRAQAPKSLVKQLDAARAGGAPSNPAKKKAPAKAKAPAKKAKAPAKKAAPAKKKAKRH